MHRMDMNDLCDRLMTPREEPVGLRRFMVWLDSLPCSCGGEAHDECTPDDDD